MIIGITGVAGSGKSTVATLLTKHRFVSMGLADPMKRFCAEVFGFTYEQLYGPSEARNAEDRRYVRMKAGQLGTTIVAYGDEGMPILDPCPKEDIYLTPRYALQQLGTEWARSCYRNVWIEHALRTASRLLEEQPHQSGYLYYPDIGLEFTTIFPGYAGVVFSDLRYSNEFEAVRAAGGKLLRMKRGQNSTEHPNSYSQHATEQEQLSFEDDYFDYVIDNNDTPEREFTLDDLADAVDKLVLTLC